MNKRILVELVLVVGIIGFSFQIAHQHKEIIDLRRNITTLKKKQKKHEEKEVQLRSENERLSDEVSAATESQKNDQQRPANTETTVESNSEFISVVTKLFTANLNFMPENYDERKAEVSNYLSDDLRKEYFGQKRNTYQDANGTFSKLEYIEIYPKRSQTDVVEGLVIVKHRNRQRGQNWIERMNIFKVTYDGLSNKISRIENLGSGYLVAQKK